ncbi:hypothetical protein [Sphingomonas mali]|uniref:hypothetical protein n=1 Tax=Sphingomonas mali TaxID=40682 RepID=UPI00082D451B|nr:hypothetical protein [Sphingomonas mali]
MARTRLLLFALVWLSCVWFGSWALNPNNATRIYAGMALVERGDARIDTYQALTIDKAEFGGHFFMDKAPGMTLLSLPAMAIADHVGSPLEYVPPTIYDANFEHYMTVRLRLAVALVSAVIAALAALAMHDLGLRLTGSANGALVAGLGFALGTPVWGWSTTLFGHAPVAGLFVIAVWALWRAGEGRAMRFAAIGGAALGLAVLIEFEAALAGSVIAIWGALRLWRTDRRAVLAAAGAGLVTLLVPFMTYNMIAFGTPFRFGYSGVVGFAGMDQGLFGLTSPKPMVLLKILVGMRRGLLWVAPVLVPATVGLWLLGRKHRGLAIMLAAAALTVLLVNSAYVYWDGGHSTGPRHSVPAIGLIVIGLAPFWTSLRFAWGRAATVALLLVSVVINLMIAAANITTPDTYRFPLADPILTAWKAGALRTLPSDFLGWSPIAGVGAYLTVALMLISALLARRPTGRSNDSQRQTNLAVDRKR